jgi:hypothetical protein
MRRAQIERMRQSISVLIHSQFAQLKLSLRQVGCPRSALIRVATSLIRPVRLPVIRFGEKSSNALNYFRFVPQKGRKIGLNRQSPCFSPCLQGAACRRPVWPDCVRHQEVRANRRDFRASEIARHFRSLCSPNAEPSRRTRPPHAPPSNLRRRAGLSVNRRYSQIACRHRTVAVPWTHVE